MFKRKNEEVNKAPTTEDISPDVETVKEALEDGFKKSAEKLEELRAGRNLSDLPLSDPYWEYQNAHTLAHHKHLIRTDKAQLVKGKPIDKNKLVEEVK